MKSQDELNEKQRQEYAAEQERLKSSGEMGGGRNIVWWKPVVGRNVVRVLPPRGKEKFYFATRQHYVRSESGKKFPYNCLRQDPKHEEASICPLCQYVAELAKAKRLQEVDDFRAKTRCYMNIINRKDEAKGVQVWGAPPTPFYDILGIFLDPDWNMDITDPESGVDVVVERVGTGRTDTNYSIRPRPRSTSVEFNKEDLVDLRSLVIEASFEELEGVVKELEEKGAISGTERGQAGEREKPEGKSQKRSAKKKDKEEGEHPKCFGKKFDGDDELCQECEFGEECEEVVKQGEKETSDEPQSLRDRMNK